MKISDLPFEILQSMTLSSRSVVKAMIPLGRGFENASSDVFLMIPFSVSMTTYFVVDKSVNRENRLNFLVGPERENVRDRFTFARAGRQRKLVNFHPEEFALVRKEQEPRFRIGDENLPKQNLLRAFQNL